MAETDGSNPCRPWRGHGNDGNVVEAWTHKGAIPAPLLRSLCYVRIASAILAAHLHQGRRGDERIIVVNSKTVSGAVKISHIKTAIVDYGKNVIRLDPIADIGKAKKFHSPSGNSWIDSWA